MKKISTILFGCLHIVLLCAQDITNDGKLIADKIIGQVGNKIILKSDVDNAITDYKRQGALSIPTDCEILQGQFIQKMLVLQAQRDSLPVSEDDVEAALDSKIRTFINMYGSREQLERVAGRSVYQLKEDFRVAFREQLLANEMRKKIIENVKITPNEASAYFNAIPKDKLPYFESQVELSQIIIEPKANQDVDDYVIQQLLEYKRQIEDGVRTFQQVASAYSQDPGVRENQGQYNITRGGKDFDPVFTSAAFRLKVGQISQPIKTRFGYHLIKLVSRFGDDAVVQHILLIPPITQEEIDAAKHILDSARILLLEKKMDFGTAVSKFSTEDNSKFNAGNIMGADGSTFITIDQIQDKDIVALIAKMRVGDISEPIDNTNERGTKIVRIVYFKTRTDAHRENLHDDYNKISQAALEKKRQDVLQKWIQHRIADYYILVDNSYDKCAELRTWIDNSSNSKIQKAK